MTTNPERTLPHNLEAERSVLGVILVTRGKALDEVADRVDPEMFFREQHQRIYRAMLELYGRGEGIDFVTLKEELGVKLEAAGGPSLIASLADGVPTSTNLPFYVRIVRDKHAQRQLIFAANKLLTAAYSEDDEPGVLLDSAERTFLDLAMRTIPGDLMPGEELVREIFPVLEAINDAKRSITGIETGFPSLDHFTKGLQPGHLNILGGRPSQGKTTLAMQMALHIAKSAPVAFFSVEMSRQEQTFRILSTIGGFDGHQLQCGQLPMHDRAKLSDALEALSSQYQFWLDDSPNLTAMQIRSRARRMKAKGGLGLIVVDYIQLLTHPKADSREASVAATSRMLKLIARELDVPVLALCQLNRSVEQRKDQRPTLADLRESGSLEQDADVVLLIYRSPAQSDGAVRSAPPTELIISKQRNGPAPTSVDMVFHGDVYRFEEVEGRS